jgi:hypothetical protein
VVRRRRALLGLLPAAAWAAAVAGGVSAAPGLRPATIPGYGVSLSVPSAWVAGRLTHAGGSGARLVYVFRSPTAPAGFRPNLNLIVGPIPRGETLRRWLLGAQAAQYLAIGRARRLTIGGKPAVGYVSTKLEHVAGRFLLTDEYAFARNGKAYLFTYTSLAIDRARYEGTFDSSARTIRFLDVE